MTDQTAAQSHATQPQDAEHKDNLLGICHAIGEDFGFNPLWLRIGLAAGILFAPVAVVAAYLGLGVVVLASRLIAPDPKPRRSAEVTSLPERPTAPSTPVDLPKAA